MTNNEIHVQFRFRSQIKANAYIDGAIDRRQIGNLRLLLLLHLDELNWIRFALNKIWRKKSNKSNKTIFLFTKTERVIWNWHVCFRRFMYSVAWKSVKRNRRSIIIHIQVCVCVCFFISAVASYLFADFHLFWVADWLTIVASWLKIKSQQSNK